MQNTTLYRHTQAEKLPDVIQRQLNFELFQIRALSRMDKTIESFFGDTSHKKVRK